MGRPAHYSVEIVARCQNLIELLVDQAGTDPETIARWRGPLRTTFLLAMSTPMLVLPMERLFKPLLRKAGVADDSGLDKAVSDRVLKTFADGRPFQDADFYEEYAWSYIDAANAFSIADAWPDAIFDQLDTAEASAAAGAAPAASILECLRNAISHGAVVYLDERGRQSEDVTNMLGFAAFPALNRRYELRVLRITVEKYEHFLAAWSRWLSHAGVEAKLAQEGPGWFDGEPFAA